MTAQMSDDEISDAVRTLEGWEREGDYLIRSVEADSFADGIKMVDAVAAVADEREHHPDIDIRYTTVNFALSTHSAGGITANDIDLAREISRIVDTS